jgi:hypothetical protein
MSYTINKTNGEVFITLQDGTLDTSCSVGLIGRNYDGYGEVSNDNVLHLLENFSNKSPPISPISGQMWFNSETGLMNVYNDSTLQWHPVGSPIMSISPPITPIDGELWLNTNKNCQLNIYFQGVWYPINESTVGFGLSKSKSMVLTDINNVQQPVVIFVVSNIVLAIISASTFAIDNSNDIIDGISGFNRFTQINIGITFSSLSTMHGNLIGNATSATYLQNPCKINNVSFTGDADNITVKANTNHPLFNGKYIVGSQFDGSGDITWDVDADSNNTNNKVVARDTNGNFAANVITANDFVGQFSGQVTSGPGTSVFDTIQVNTLLGVNFGGNASSASTLKPGAKINGVQFTGESNITVGINASNISGTTLANNVVLSNLTSVGVLSSLNVANAGITVGGINSTNSISIGIQSTPTSSTGLTPAINSYSGRLDLTLNDNAGAISLSFVDTYEAASLSTTGPALIPSLVNAINLGSPEYKFNTMYATTFNGVATSAAYADVAENYLSDEEYLYGTVLEFGGEFEITIASLHSPRIAGVVSLNPAHLMNCDCNGLTVPVALLGKVPCKVIGKVQKGDMLISAGNGYAKAAIYPQIGTVIGKALADYDSDQPGEIQIAVGRL